MNQCSSKYNDYKPFITLLTSVIAAICFSFTAYSTTSAQTLIPNVSLDVSSVDTIKPVTVDQVQTPVVDQTAVPTRMIPTPTSTGIVEVPTEVFAGVVKTENDESTSATVTINGRAVEVGENGAFEFKVPRTRDSRYVINVERPGYVPISQIYIGTGLTELDLKLQRAEVYDIKAQRKINVTDSRGTQIVIKRNSLVGANGKVASGPLQLLMYTYDLTREEMVGDMSGINREGRLVSMKSAGAFFAEFRDADGNRYNLGPDAYADVSIPAEQTNDENEPLKAPDNLLLWSYDKEAGLWRAEESTEQKNGRHVGRVSHFSTWNFDWEKQEPACVQLTVDADYLAANSPIQVKVVVNGTSVRHLTITMVNNALYNLPAFATLEFFTPPPYTSPAFLTVNSGAPWGGTGVPPFPYDDCNGDGHIGPGAIKGIKFNDLNGNGVQDPGEPGIPGWTIEIYDSSGTLVNTVLTDANGEYSFDLLSPDTYTVSEVLPSDWTQTFPASGSHTVVINSGTVVADIDFGNQYKHKPCGPLDIVFVIDDTGSMRGALTNVKNGLSNIVTTAIGVSSGNYKMGLVSFKDNITVRDDLAASNAASVLTNINSLSAIGGVGGPEASDESLNTVINNLPVGTRPQNIAFNGAWRPSVRKLIVLVTDATPGGFDDTYTVGVDDVNAGLRATEAATAGIEIAAIYVPKAWSMSDAVPIMQNYATTTGGIYTQTASDGSGTATAIIEAIQACPDMAIEKSANPDPFQVGEPASYILNVTNVGTGPTVGMPSVFDTLPAGIVPVAVTVAPSTPTGWSCTITGQTVQCDALGTVAPGESYTITIDVDVTNAASDVVRNCAHIRDTTLTSDPTIPIPLPAIDPNNLSCIKTEVLPPNNPDMTIEKLADPDPFQVGEPASYILTVTNVGTGTTTSPTWVIDNLPTGIVPITVTVSPTPTNWICNILGQNVQCQAPGSIGPGESYTIVIEVEVTDEAVPGVQNCVGVSLQGDGDYDNNESCIYTEVLPNVPDMTIEKVADPDPFQVGEPASYILTVTNVGTGTTTSPTWVIDNLPTGIVPITVTVSPTPTNWICNIFGQNVQCQAPGPIGPGESYTIVIEVEVTDEAVPGVQNCAGVSLEGDGDYDNNESCVQTEVLDSLKIHGQKWNDENGNGIQDSGETGLEGWTIFLQDSAGTVISTTTDVDGNYWFMGLISGTYTVLEVIQPGWTQTNPLGGGHDVTLDDETIENVDFGNWFNQDESCAAGWDVNMGNNDVNTVEFGMSISNGTGANATYSMNIVGYPGFTVNGFTTVPAQPIPVSSMGSTYVQVSLSPLPTFTGPSGQYQVIVTNNATGYSFSCSGQIWQSDLLSVQPLDNELFRAIQPWKAEEVVFEVENLTTEEQTVNLEIVEMFGLPGKEIKAIRINGQEPGVPVQSQVIIPAGQTIEVGVEIELAKDIPNGIGDIILFADIDGDGNPEVATSILIRQNEPAADIYIMPEEGSVFITELYTIEVQVDNIQDFYGNQLEITYDPTIVEVVDADSVSPGVQIHHGDFLAPETVNENSANNSTGVIRYSTSLQGNQPGVDGSGVLARIVFRGLVVGTSPIALDNVILSDSQSVAISVSDQDGQVVVEELSYDIGDQIILERRGDDNNSGTEVCIDSQCVTTGDDGSYTLSNVPASGTVQVSRQSYLSSSYDYSAATGGLNSLPEVTLLGGDINQDGVINIDDAVLVGLAWNSTPADAHWDVRADVTDDGKVDILDMVAVQFNWNETAPTLWSALRSASGRSFHAIVHTARVEGVYTTDAEAQVAIAPAVSTIAELNGSTKVDIMAEDVTGLYGFTVVSSFDPEKVQVVDINPNQSGVQIQVGDLLDPAHQFVVFNQVDNEKGVLELSVTQTHPAEAKSGSGVLGTVTFKAVGMNETTVELTSSTRLVDSSRPDPQVIAVAIEDGMLQLPLNMRIFLPMIVR